MHTIRHIVLTIILAILTTQAGAAVNHTSQAMLLNKGKAYLDKSDYNTALAKFLEYIQNEEKAASKDTAALLDAYNNIGGIYTLYQDYAQALDMYENGYRLSVESGRHEWQFRFLNNMIGANCNIGNTEDAERLNTKVKHLTGVNLSMQHYYYCFNNGFIAGYKNLPDEKIKWMNHAIATVNRYHLPQKLLIYPYSEIYQYYEKQGQLNMALSTLLKYDSLVHVINNDKKRVDNNGMAYLFADCYKGLMRIYTKLGNKEKALYYQNEFFRYNDSLLNVNEFSKIRNQHLNYESRQTQLIIDSQRKTILYQTICLCMLAVLVVTAAVAIIIIKRQRKALYDTNIALFDRNNELVEAELKTVKPIVAAQAESQQTTTSAAISEHLLQAISNAMQNTANFCNPDFSLSMLAQIVESNTNYVSQAINTSFNKNFRSLLNEYRIKEAMRRMKDNDTYGNYSIQGISESVGFKSASNFIAAFKKMTGMTPSLYQKLSKNE